MVAVLLIGSLAVSFAPPLLGLTLANAQGTSMDPGIKQGDALVIAPATGDDVGPGDVVLFTRDGLPILHRVVEKGVNPSGDVYLVTRGDNATKADAPIRVSEVRGELAGRVPLLGAVSRGLGGDNGFATLRWAIIGAASTCCAAVIGLLGRARRPRAASRVAGPEA